MIRIVDHLNGWTEHTKVWWGRLPDSCQFVTFILSSMNCFNLYATSATSSPLSYNFCINANLGSDIDTILAKVDNIFLCQWKIFLIKFPCYLFHNLWDTKMMQNCFIRKFSSKAARWQFWSIAGGWWWFIYSLRSGDLGSTPPHTSSHPHVPSTSPVSTLSTSLSLSYTKSPRSQIHFLCFIYFIHPIWPFLLKLVSWKQDDFGVKNRW